MTPEILAQAAQPFFTTKGPDEGSGLGLSMVYGFAEQSGGRLDIESKPGKGTKARLFLPRALADQSVHEDPLAGGPAMAMDEVSILLVEDQPAVRRLTRRILARQGYKIREADNAEAALRILDNQSDIDLLLTDIVLPGGVGGVELARRAKVKLPDLKLLYASGYASDPARGDITGRLDAPLLRKPYKPDELLRLIEDVMSKVKPPRV